MSSVILIYKTDAWHSYASRDLIACTTAQPAWDLTMSRIVALCKLQAKKEGEKLNEDDLYNIKHIRQTQGYSGEGEFVWEEIETDALL